MTRKPRQCRVTEALLVLIHPFNQIVYKFAYLATGKFDFKSSSIIAFINKSKSINISIIITNIFYAIVSNAMPNIQ